MLRNPGSMMRTRPDPAASMPPRPKGDRVKAASAANRKAADAFAASVLPIIVDFRSAGISSRYAIVQALNERGVPTARSRQWTCTAIRNLLARADHARVG
jgi:hypothetical protein